MIFVVGGAYQGKREYVRRTFGDDCQVINGYHLCVKEQLEKGLSPMEEAEKLLQLPTEGTERIIISDEIGYGLVPVDKAERHYREMSGRVNCYLAEQAQQVIRVVCGQGQRIK